MYKDLMNYVRGCLQCTIVGRAEQKKIPASMPIPVDHPFQIVGVDIMELPLTARETNIKWFSKTFLQSGL